MVVGQFSGKEAMAAVGRNAPVIGLLVNLSVGIPLRNNVMIGQADRSELWGREGRAVPADAETPSFAESAQHGGLCGSRNLRRAAHMDFTVFR